MQVGVSRVFAHRRCDFMQACHDISLHENVGNYR